MQVQIFSGYYEEHKHLYEDIYNLTQPVSWIYPNYSEWYHNTFLPDLKRGNRAYVLASYHWNLLGCCLLKKTPEEQKICTLFVDQNHRRQGVGSDLLSASLQELDGQPVITVSYGVLGSVAPLLRKFGFEMISAKSKNNPAEVCFQKVYPVRIQQHQSVFSKVSCEKAKTIS